ncbi:MAG: hypothetical protein OCU22_00680 [Canidatus Methanoxibalbensis ujae]|nr:hypothetical protein [Candidatus Methanoxibalbensis ujae]
MSISPSLDFLVKNRGLREGSSRETCGVAGWQGHKCVYGEETLERIEEMGVERSAFIRGAVEKMLGSDVFKEREKLRAEVRRLKKLLQESERRINALEKEVAEKERVIAELRERLERRGALEGKGKKNNK